MEGIGMKEVFDQATRVMEQFFEQWKKLAGGGAEWPKNAGAASKEAMGQWIATMRTACESNMDAWGKLTQQGEEIFFKMFKQSPMYNDRAESTMKQAWANMTRAQKAQRDVLAASLARLEELIKGL